MRWFTSDLHFGHNNIIRYCDRPFVDAEQMNDAIISVWNKTVDPSDEVWILGDLAMGHLRDTVPLAGRLNGMITLLCGNHDAPWVGRSAKTRARHHDLYASTGMKVLPGETSTVEIGGRSVDCSHFPYLGDSHDQDRFTEHRPLDKGGWLLHGHVHEVWRQNNRQINVGMDAWGGELVSEDQIVALIDAGPNDVGSIDWSC